MRLFAFLLTLIFLSSCECLTTRVGCAPDNYTGFFRILDAGTGHDLVFGPNSIYDETQIKFYSLNGPDTSFFNFHNAFMNSDTVLQVEFSSRPGVAYMRFGNGDIDTLNISYASMERNCCSMYNYISQYRYNNKTDVPGDRAPQEFRK